MDNLKFLPFYERLTIRFPGYIPGKILVSTLLGFSFLAAHYVNIGDKFLNNWSWFLSVLIVTAMLCLYYATHTLRIMLSVMAARLRPDGDEVYMCPLKRILTDRNFVLAGLFFGLLNCGLGFCFGLPKWSNRITILSGYLLVGFVCGMAVLGIYGVYVSIRAFSRNAKPPFDFTSPDRCGGTVFLGESLMVFGAITLTVGVMISVYILKEQWAYEDTPWIKSLKYSWVAFPYVASLVVLIAPAVLINKALRDYKMEQESVAQDRLTKIRNKLESNEYNVAERKGLREDYEFHTSIRMDLHTMRTWPYGRIANLKYLAVFAANSFASVDSVLRWTENSVITEWAKILFPS